MRVGADAYWLTDKRCTNRKHYSRDIRTRKNKIVWEGCSLLERIYMIVILVLLLSLMPRVEMSKTLQTPGGARPAETEDFTRPKWPFQKLSRPQLSFPTWVKNRRFLGPKAHSPKIIDHSPKPKSSKHQTQKPRRKTTRQQPYSDKAPNTRSRLRTQLHTRWPNNRSTKQDQPPPTHPFLSSTYRIPTTTLLRSPTKLKNHIQETSKP